MKQQMKTGPLLAVSLVLAAAMAAFAFWMAARVPAGTMLATHWNAAGEADGHMPVLKALLFPAGIVTLLSLVLAVIPRIEPLQDRLEGSAPLLRASWIGVLALMVLVEIKVAGPLLGWHFGNGLVLAGVGLLFMLIGNMLPKSRPGFFVGIRTPWTIIDTDIWIATHRLGGRLFMGAGLVIVIMALLPLAPQVQTMGTLVAALAAALLPAAYSWWLWSRRAA